MMHASDKREDVNYILNILLRFLSPAAPEAD